MSIPDRQQAMVMNGPGISPEAVTRPVHEPGIGQALVEPPKSPHENVGPRRALLL